MTLRSGQDQDPQVREVQRDHVRQDRPDGQDRNQWDGRDRQDGRDQQDQQDQRDPDPRTAVPRTADERTTLTAMQRPGR
ncbi:hypothetical protein ACIQCR_11570 [Streptomyces sp. NPDC093249]|uniref:hypothetical protein n=1 Tax=unclassified Streptomyces TaxID=2593676 RepID=UPI003828AC3A